MIDLTVKTLDSQNHAFSLENDQITVRGFKEYIAESVAVPADSQRLIYCGRVLQDEKKLNDYDVNGKVIHLVQRAPPQPGHRGNDGAQSQGPNHGQTWPGPHRTHFRIPGAQVHANAMYLGAMSVPADIVEGHAYPLPHLSERLSNSRLVVARFMLDRANELVDRLEDPSCPLDPPSSENNQPPLSQQVQVQEIETEHEDNNEGNNNGGTRLAEATVAVIAAALSAAGANNLGFFRGNDDEAAEARSSNATNDESQPEAQQQQAQPEQPSTTNAEGQSNRNAQQQQQQQQQLPRPRQMSELLERLLITQDRLGPYIDRYRLLMQSDPSLSPGAGPEGVEESQRIVDGVSECLHYMSHACHALSDILVDMEQQPPRNILCRPIVIQHSAILQPGIPIQVEAHISLHGRNANNNNGNEESTETSSTVTQPESSEAPAEDRSQPQESEATNRPQREQAQEQAQAPFGTVYNLPNNVEMLMEVNPEGSIDTAPGGEQNQTGETNNNNTGRINRTTVFPWGSAPPPDFIRNLIQVVSGHTIPAGITTTTITTRNPPLNIGGQQSIATTLDSGNTNAGQSTQARSNVGTHPTTATQTRSTSRPHVFHQQTHPLGVGMSIAQGLDFDPFLLCNSHHVRRIPTAISSTVTASQGTQTSETPATETTAQAPHASASTTTTSASSTNTTPQQTPSQSSNNNNNLLMNMLQQILDSASTGQPQANVNMNGNIPDLAESLGNIMQMFGVDNVRVGIVGDSNSASTEAPTSADQPENRGRLMDVFSALEASREENFLVNLSDVLIHNMTPERVIRLRSGLSEPIAYLRRPVLRFLQLAFRNCSPEMMQEQATERLVTQLRPHLQNLLAAEEEVGGRGGSRVDICATILSLLRQYIRDMLRVSCNNEIDDARFGQEILTLLDHLAIKLCTVLRYCIRGGQAGLEAVASRFMDRLVSAMAEGIHPALRQWMLNQQSVYFRTYSLRFSQPPDSEIIPLLVYKDAPSQASNASSVSANPPSQAQSDVEPMETETVEDRRVYEAAIPDDGEEIPETFPGHETLPSDWVPIIARDGVRQRRQLQMQGMTNGGVTAFSDAYLGAMPTKRRKIIEQQKPRLLVSPTPNHSAITASMERLVREGVGRAGVEEMEGAAVAVAADPGVRRAFGQAIRDCLNPRRYTSPDFPDPLRFPNATKFFAEQERPPK